MGPKRMTSASSASKRATGLMNAGTEDSDAPEAEATREDIRKAINIYNTILGVLALETEDIEADQDPIEGTILAKRAASSAENQAISRGTVLR